VFVFPELLHLEGRISLCGLRFLQWLSLAGTNDSFLMEDFVKAGYNSTELWTLNNCRLYLQVTTIADISDHMGEHVLPNVVVQGKQTPMITMS